MPGPYIHIAVSDRVRASLRDWSSWGAGKSTASVASLNLNGPSPKQVAELAAAHPSYYALGAVGPDLFFFLPDFRAVCVRGRRVPIANFLIGVTEFLEEAYEALDEWVLEDWERYFGPGNENVEEALSRLTGDLTTVVSDITASFGSIATTALLSLATQARDWFGMFSLGLNKGYDNQDFFWSDMLHYRKTSRFGRSLWTLANEREASGQPTPAEAKEIADQLRAYALGYITHLATDVAGHPFVNEKSGGPYRTHWQRHHLVENHMDAQTYDVDHGGDYTYNMLTESALHYRVSFKDSGEDGPTPPWYDPSDHSLHALYVKRRHLDLDSEMPSELAELLFRAMGQTYQTSAPPSLGAPAESSPRIIMGGDGRPAPEVIQNAYLLLFRYLKFSMLDGFDHEKPSPPELFPNLDFPQLTDPHDDPPNEGDDDDDDFWHSLLRLIRFLRWLVAVALWLVTILPAIVLDVATYLPRLVAYYTIQLPLYYMVKAERRIMVMTGYLHPMRDEIDDGLVRLCRGHDDAFLSMLKDMNDTLGGVDDLSLSTITAQAEKLMDILKLSASEAMAQALGTAGLSSTRPEEPPPNSNYPHSHPLDAQGRPVEYHAPWQYPTSPTELDPTFAGPYECGDTSHVLLDGDIPGTQALRTAYEHAASPAATDAISFAQATKTANLGDPVNFSEYLMWQLTRVDIPANQQTQLTDWNLDADRGYAYKCWDWNRHHPPQPGASSGHVLLDMEGHQYMEPCTPPPQSEDPNAERPCAPPPKAAHDPKKPLAIHYTDQPDPGC